MGRTKKPRKVYRPRGVGPQGSLRLQPWRLNAAFGPIEQLLTQIERGDALDVSESGVMTFQAAEVGATCHVVDSVRGLAETYDIARLRDPSCPNTQPLHHLANQVERDEALTQDDIAACRSCLTNLRHYTAKMPVAHFIDLVQTAAMKWSMDDLEGSADREAGPQSPEA